MPRAQLTSTDHNTVAHYVGRRAAGYAAYRRVRRPRFVDLFAEKIEEWVDHSHAEVRADVAYKGLLAMSVADSRQGGGEPGSDDENVRRRPLAIALDGFRARDPEPVPGPPPSVQAYEERWRYRPAAG